ncbi:MAG TPA: hypothetical protein DCG75_09705 [Bacteroidales bacterium]|nr:hypothetical protein [Bacteroidales bacterium]
MSVTLKKHLLIVFISLSILPLFGQENDSLFYLRGQVISKDGKYPVAMAHIINVDKKWGVVADTSGCFNIWVKPSDTLNISAIGFDYFQYGIPGIIKDSLVKIYLQNRYYEIPEVSISYLGTYKEFEYKVVNLKLPEIHFHPQIEGIIKHVDFPLVMEPTITSPASLIYSMFSKEAKSIKKYIKLTENQDEVDELRERYNEHVIRNLTGLSGEEAQDFMKFCNFQDSYILSIDDYNLYSEILLRFKAFKKQTQDSVKRE